MRHKYDKDIDDIPTLSQKMPKWEYKTENISEDLEKRLDDLGAMGWELVTIEKTDAVKDGNVVEYMWTVFKRPVF